MLLTITTDTHPAADLGYLLHKHPGRAQSFPLSFGQAHVFYPEVRDDHCTAALLLEVDPVSLVRGGRSAAAGPLEQYVNDRPYVASSFMSVAISEVYGTALAGNCKLRPEACAQALSLRASIAVLPCREGEPHLRRLFEPLGYRVTAHRYPLDLVYPEWGESRYYRVELENKVRLSELLTHLYVLLPALDDDKHYWVGEDEVEKLLRRGQGWLESHPAKDVITRRYLRHQRSLTESALKQLVIGESPDAEAALEERSREEEAIERPISLNEQRMGAALAALRASGARRVLDLGCGEGKLLRALLAEPQFTEIVGMDVSYRALAIARDRLHIERLPERQQARIRMLHGSLLYRDDRLAGYDAAAAVEVIEHLDAPRLAAFEQVLFQYARPATAVITTPNVEYNVRFPTLPAGRLRHRDHRFEWSRAQFQQWASRTGERFGYTPRFAPIGPDDPEVGSPTQMAIFTRNDSQAIS